MKAVLNILVLCLISALGASAESLDKTIQVSGSSLFGISRGGGLFGGGGKKDE
jgi:hypothetical protein